MKKKAIIIGIILLIFLLIFLIWYKYAYNKPEISQKVQKLEIILGEKFLFIEEYKEKYVIDYQLFDLDNDNFKDDVILIGNKQNFDDNFANEICLVIRNGNNGEYDTYDIKDLEGYESHISLFDVTNDEKMEIIISTKLGRKKNSTSNVVLNYGDRKFNEIFGLQNSKGVEVSGEYLDRYETKITVNSIGKVFNIDVSDKKEYYQRNNVYDKNDVLIKKNIIIKSHDINLLEPIQIEGNKYGIQTSQTIIGIDKTDIIDVITAKWIFENNTFMLHEIIRSKDGKNIVKKCINDIIYIERSFYGKKVSMEKWNNAISSTCCNG